jgi:hypothetical protein
MSDDTTHVYNATDGPLIIDQAGRVLGARTRSDQAVDASVSPVSGHLAAGRMVRVSSATADVDDDGAKQVEAAEPAAPAEPEPKTSSRRQRAGTTTTQEG